MADQTPLLSHNGSVDSETPKLKAENHNPSLDDKIECCIGDAGWTRFLQAVLISFAWAFDAQQTFISVFTDAEPTWHCLPLGNETCYSVANPCQLPKDAWAWDMPAVTSIISEWSLECANSILTGLPASSFFVGCLLGGLLLATLADSSLGRKNMLLLSTLLMAMAGILTILSTNIWIYSIFRFVSGFGRATIGTCALVLSTELVGKRWRGQVGIIGFFCFALGFLSLPAIGYLNRGSSWRVLYLWTCVPTLLYCILVHLFVRESPRWLFVRGRKEEFVATLKTMAPAANRSSLTLSFFGTSIEQEPEEVGLYSAIKILLQKRWAFRRLMAVMVVAFGIGMMYYGMPLGVGSLSLNLYLSVMLNALSELPSSLLTIFLIGSLNRKLSILGLTLLSGVCSVMCAVTGTVEKRLQIGLELVSFFAACTAINVILIYTVELFPTCVRNSAVSMARQTLVFGGVFSPMLIAAGRRNAFLSYGVFGLATGLCGLFALCLPDTRGRPFCDTMDEEDDLQKPTTHTDDAV